MRNYLRFLRRCAGVSLDGDWRYYAWIGALAAALRRRAQRLRQAVCRRPRDHRHERPGLLGRLHRQLHLPRGHGGRGRHARDPGLHLQERGPPRPRHLRRAARGGRDPDVPRVRDRGPRPPRPLLAPDPGHRRLPFPGLDAELGRPRPERLPAPQRLHLRLPPLLPLPEQEGRRSGSTSPSSSSPSSGPSRSTRSRRSSTSAWAGGPSGTPRSSAPASSPRRSPPAPPSSSWRCRWSAAQAPPPAGSNGAHAAGRCRGAARSWCAARRPPRTWTCSPRTCRSSSPFHSRSAGHAWRARRFSTSPPATSSCTRGQLTTDAFFVLKGRVVVRREEGGRYRTTRNIGPGEQFGEVSALAGTPRAATATAAEPPEVLCLPQESLRRLMQQPEDERDHHLADGRAAHDHPTEACSSSGPSCRSR